MIGKLIGGALKGGLGKGLMKGAGGILGKGGGGLLKGLGGGGGGGILGKALEAVGGPQGIMDLVTQFAQGGGQAAGGEQAAAPAGGAQGAAPAGQGEANADNPLVKLAKQFANAKTPEDVDKLVKAIGDKLGKQMSPELKGVIDKVAEARKATLGGADLAKAA